MNARLPPIDQTYVTDLLAEWVQINSVNPMASQGKAAETDPDRPGETVFARRVAEELERLGAAVEVLSATEAGPDAAARPNVTGRWEGRGGGPEIILCSHLDTVDVTGMAAPFDPVVRDGRMFGRGSLDAKGQLAMFLGAVQATRNLSGPLPVHVTFAAVSDEEDQSVGARSLLRTLRGDFCIIGEPTGLDLVVAHKGFCWIEIETRGRACHGSVPEQGVDAIAKMAEVIRGVEALKPGLRARSHPLLDHPGLHMGVIEGGSGPSTVPDRCRLTLEVRTCRREEAEDIFSEIRDALRRLADSDPDLEAEARLGVVRHPMEIAPDHPLVTGLSTAVEAQRGRAPRRNVIGAWTDAAFFAEKMPTVIFGPGDLSLAHSKEEHVPLDEVIEGAGAVLRFLLSPPNTG